MSSKATNSVSHQTFARRISMLDASLGSIKKFFHDPEITEVIVNPDGRLWVEDKQGWRDTRIFIEANHALNIINICATMVGDVCNPSRPILSAEMPESGFRFEANIPPITEGPSFVIRKFAEKFFSLEDYVRSGVLNQTCADYIKQAVIEKQNIIVCGATGSGKTTFMKTLLNLIPQHERLIIIEDTRELKCECPNITNLKSAPGVAGMTDLLKSCMRQKPDRIILGEVRGAEALVMLKSWNTGHPGGICSFHSGPGVNALFRLEQMISEAVSNVPKELIGDAVNLIVHIIKGVSGRYVDDVSQVKGFDGKNYLLERMEL